MTRFRIGIGILLVLLTFGLGVQLWMDAACAPISKALEAAQTAAAAGRWPEAEQHRKEADTLWHAHWHSFAALADHQPMEDIDSLLAQLTVFSRDQATLEFTSTAAALSRLVAAMADAHKLSWWNLL